MTPKDPLAELDELIAKYDDWHECEEYHIHDGTGEHEGHTPLPHDFDDDKLKAGLKGIFQAHQQELLSELLGQKLWVDVADDKKRNKTKWRIEAVPVSVIERKIGELNG